MSTSGVFCPQCGIRLATKTSSGIVRVLEGVRVRLRAHSAELTCTCGFTKITPYPKPKEAA